MSPFFTLQLKQETESETVLTSGSPNRSSRGSGEKGAPFKPESDAFERLGRSSILLTPVFLESRELKTFPPLGRREEPNSEKTNTAAHLCQRTAVVNTGRQEVLQVSRVCRLTATFSFSFLRDPLPQNPPPTPLLRNT